MTRSLRRSSLRIAPRLRIGSGARVVHLRSSQAHGARRKELKSCECLKHRSPPLPLRAAGQRANATAYLRSPILTAMAVAISMSCDSAPVLCTRITPPLRVLPMALSMQLTSPERIFRTVTWPLCAASTGVKRIFLRDDRRDQINAWLPLVPQFPVGRSARTVVPKASS